MSEEAKEQEYIFTIKKGEGEQMMSFGNATEATLNVKTATPLTCNNTTGTNVTFDNGEIVNVKCVNTPITVSADVDASAPPDTAFYKNEIIKKIDEFKSIINKDMSTLTTNPDTPIISTYYDQEVGSINKYINDINKLNTENSIDPLPLEVLTQIGVVNDTEKDKETKINNLTILLNNMDSKLDKLKAQLDAMQGGRRSRRTRRNRRSTKRRNQKKKVRRYSKKR